MKTNKLILFIILYIGLNVQLYAQQSTDEDYSIAIEEFFNVKAGGTAWMNGLNVLDIKTLSKIAKESKPNLSSSQCKELAILYKEKKLKKDYMKLFIPIFRRKLITVEDIQKILDEMKKPEYKVAQEHYLMAEEHSLQIMPQFLKTPTDTVDCPEGYKQAFQLYYERSEAKSMTESLFKPLIGAMIDNFELGEAAIMKIVMEHSYTLSLNAFYGIVTEEDLQTLTAVESLPEQQRVNHALTEFVGTNFQRHTESILLSYIRWVEMMCAIRNWR